MSQNPNKKEAPFQKEGLFCLTYKKDKAILPTSDKIQIYHDNTKSPRISNIKLRYKMGLAVLDNRRILLDENTTNTPKRI